MIVCVISVVKEGCELAKRFDTDDTFQSEVGLKRQPASKVIGADWPDRSVIEKFYA